MLGPLPMRRRLSTGTTSDPTPAWGWVFEGWMVRGRWLVLAVLLPSTFLSASPGAFLLSMVLAAANAAMAITLTMVACKERLALVRYTATAVDWLMNYLVFVLLVDGSLPHLSFATAILALESGFRFGVAGLAGTFAVGVATSSMAWYREAFAGHGELTGLELKMALEWLLVDLVAFVVCLGTLRAGHEWLIWDSMKEKALELELDVFRSGLSQREMEILPLLARVELTYEDIGQELCVSSETIKTHVNRASTKLELKPKGRWMLVEEARRRHLIQ